MRNSLEYLTEAHENLDQTGNVIIAGAHLAPDFCMRLVAAVRDTLHRHHPVGETSRERCFFDGLAYPCPDVRTALKVIAVDPDQDPDEVTA